MSITQFCRRCGKDFPAGDDTISICPACRPADLAQYPDEMGEQCKGCGVLTHLDDGINCTECGAFVCKTCPATCPHTTTA